MKSIYWIFLSLKYDFLLQCFLKVWNIVSSLQSFIHSFICIPVNDLDLIVYQEVFHKSGRFSECQSEAKTWSYCTTTVVAKLGTHHAFIVSCHLLGVVCMEDAACLVLFLSGVTETTAEPWVTGAASQRRAISLWNKRTHAGSITTYVSGCGILWFDSAKTQILRTGED